MHNFSPRIPQQSSKKIGLSTPICAIIVTFNPSDSFDARLLAIREQVEQLIVVDNGSSDRFQQTLLNLERTLDSVKVIRSGRNLGIAAALNTGLEYAKNQGYVWAFTFDHDSVVGPGFTENMISTYGINERTAIVSPAYLDESNGVVLTPLRTKVINGRVEVMTTMTSGNLISLAHWEQLERFDELLFIDWVDHDFCLKCKINGLDILLNENVTLLHNLGKAKLVKQFGRTFNITNHSAIRRYYMVRNRLIVYRRYRKHLPEHFKGSILSLAKENLLVLLFEHDRLAKLSMMLRGVFDGVRGRLGALN